MSAILIPPPCPGKLVRKGNYPTRTLVYNWNTVQEVVWDQRPQWEAVSRNASTDPPKAQAPARIRNRRRVLRAARALVAARGLQGLTMRDLAVEADVSVASLYNLIGGRDDVVRALGLYLLEELDDAFLHVKASDPIERAQQLLTTLIDTVVTDLPQPLVHVLLSNVRLYSRNPPLQPSKPLTDAMEDMVASGMLNNDVSIKLIAKQVWWSHTAYLRQWADGHLNEQELRAATLHSLDLCLLSMATPAARDRLLSHARSLEKHLHRL
jgi:AcrR family transcriptional regulator